MPKKALTLKEYPTPQKATHCRLIVGTYVNNPHLQVLCPTLLDGYSCKKHAKPKFLIRNFNDPSLELWECAGCKDFLLRVEKM